MDTTETVIETAGETQADQTSQAHQPETGESAEARIARMEAALKKANSEAAANRKKLEAFERAEATKREAELSETEKLKAKLAEYEQKAKALERKELARQAADKHKLPAAFASRLQGETLEELEADAAELAKAIPAQTPKPIVTPTLPGASGKPAETPEQQKARLFPKYDPFDPEIARAMGGGVFFEEK